MCGIKTLAALAMAVAVLSGCASSHRAASSWVEPMSSQDAKTIVEDLAEFLAKEEAPAKAVLLVASPQVRQSVLATELEAALLKAGFGVSIAGTSSDTGGKRLRYAVSGLDGGVLVRVWLEERLAVCWYRRESAEGALVAGSAWTVREARVE